MTPIHADDLVHATMWERRIHEMASAWAACLAATRADAAELVPSWQQRLAQLQVRQSELIRDRVWRGGPQTLLAALDLQFRELAITAGLAWLMRPDGHHGLGGSVLELLLDQLGVVDYDGSGRVRVVLEEARVKTRADLVVYGPTWTLVVEAKVFAPEQEEQLDRLYDHWAHEPGARFVFLTSGVRVPKTSDRSRGTWTGLTWADVARVVRQAVEGRSGVAPGVYEYLATLEAYHRV